MRAKRLGAPDVLLFNRRSEKEMPAFSFEYDHSKVEGVQFHWLSQPIAIVERDGRAVAVHFGESRLGGPDASEAAGSARRSPVQSPLGEGDAGVFLRVRSLESGGRAVSLALAADRDRGARWPRGSRALRGVSIGGPRCERSGWERPTFSCSIAARRRRCRRFPSSTITRKWRACS